MRNCRSSFIKAPKKILPIFPPITFFKMEDDHLPEHLNDLWEDMDRLNALYEELMWDHEVVLEFIADYDNNQIIIKPKDD